MRVSVDAFVASPGFGGFISYIGGLCSALAARDDVELDILLPEAQPLPEFVDLPAAARIHRIELPDVAGQRAGVTWTDRVLPVALDELAPEVHLGPAFMLPPGHDRPQAVTVHDDMFERFPQFYGAETRDDERARTLRAASPASERILLTGRIPDAELPAWYRRCELFVYPSEYEGFGLGPLEAMSSGAPVLTYRNSALAEVLGEAAEHARPGVDGLREGIASLLGDGPKRERMRVQGLARAAGFRWERTAEATVEGLRTAIDRFAGSPR